MRLPRFGPAWALVAMLVPCVAAAQGTLDTVIVAGTATRPVLALDPTTDRPHVAWVSADTLYHAQRGTGGWQAEPVDVGVPATSGFALTEGFDLRVAPDGRLFALYVSQGVLYCAERGGGGWTRAPLDTLPPGFTPVSLAVDPLTREPLALWRRGPLALAIPGTIRFARRAGGVWTSQQLDTVTTSVQVVGLGVDALGRPRAAWARPRGDGVVARVLTCAIASGPNGPFVAQPVDSTLRCFLSLAVDPADGEPRIAYDTAPGGSIRYASRDAGGVWQPGLAASLSNGVPSAPSLVLDAAGDPTIAYTFFTPIAPADAPAGGPQDIASCVFVQTGDVCVVSRAGGAGTGSFQSVLCMPSQHDAANGTRALAMTSWGDLDGAWRSPGQDCSPFAVTYLRAPGPAGVGGGARAGVALAPLAPNPARAGEALRVEFALGGVTDAALELHDVAGRLVSARALGRLGAGPHAIEWSPPAARPGLYWLSVRGGGRVATRALVLVR